MPALGPQSRLMMPLKQLGVVLPVAASRQVVQVDGRTVAVLELAAAVVVVARAVVQHVS